MVKERIERAKRSAIPEDYEDLKAKAARLDEIEEQGKTKLQKAQEEAAAAQRELARARAREARGSGPAGRLGEGRARRPHHRGDPGGARAIG